MTERTGTRRRNTLGLRAAVAMGSSLQGPWIGLNSGAPPVARCRYTAARWVSPARSTAANRSE